MRTPKCAFLALLLALASTAAYGTVPNATTNAATLVAATTATLNGTVNPQNRATTVTFQYGLTNAYGTTVNGAPNSIASGSGDTSVAAALTGLTCNTTYHFRVVAVNSSGTTNGTDANFTTTACPPAAATGAATSLTATTAQLNGTVSSNGAITTVKFEYGTTIAYGTTVTASQSPLPTGATGSAVSFPLTGLTCGTTYNYRVNANNGVGPTINGNNQTFTLACPPTVVTGAASGISMTGATLGGTVSSNGAATSVWFEYGTTNSYGTSTGSTAVGNSATNLPVSIAVSGLACDTTYHFRLDGQNSGGTSTDGDATFKTGVCPVTLTKTASTAAAAVDNYVTFNLTATNPNGSTALNNVVLTDVIPTGMIYYTYVATLGTASVSGQTLTWTVLSLPPGTSAQLTLVVKPTTKGTFTNTVKSPGAIDASADILVLPSAITRYSMDEPVGSWKGAAGEVIDSGGNGLNGYRRQTATTATNTVLPGTTVLPGKILPSPTIASQQASVVGGFCNAGYFDGNAVVESASSTFFQFSQTLSASAWIYPTDVSPPSGCTVGPCVYSILSNDTNYEFHIDQGSHLYWWWGGPSLTSSATIPANQWTHIAITFDSTPTGGRQRIYINGVQDTNTSSWKGTLSANACPFYIGGDIQTGSTPLCKVLPQRNFHGMIDEAKIYNYELSAAEVKADMTLGRLCSGTFDHIRIEHDGTASVCAPKTVTLKACLNATCTALYPGTVTVQLSPSGWTLGDVVTINGGVAVVTLNNASISPPALTLGTVSVTPTPANATRCATSATGTDTTAACSISVAAAISCNADAVEVGAAAHTNIFTKLAATPFSVDLLALLNGTTTLDTAYHGAVTYDLVDTSAAACSGSSTALNTAQSYTFQLSDLGRKTVSMTCPTTTPSAQVRIKAGSTYACSTDKFAIRPSVVQLTSANANAYNATDLTMTSIPPSATAAPVVKAGNAFAIRAATTPISYAGVLALDSARLTAQLPVIGATPQSGGTVGTFALDKITVGGVDYASSVQANASSQGIAYYSEVGYLYANPGAFSDGGSLTGVDHNPTCAANNSCDCWMPTYDNNGVLIATDTRYLSDTPILASPAIPPIPANAGRYGCYVGNKAGFAFGRFIPDHFDTTATGPMACTNLPPFNPVCPSGGLMYSGQSFTTATITARAFGGGGTQNYTGAFARNVALHAWDGLGSTTLELTTGANPVGNLIANTAAMENFASGAASLTPTFSFRAVPTAPTGVFLRADEYTPAGGPAADGVSSLRTNDPATSVEGGVEAINGRLALSNATGSERRSLVIPIQAQYWSGQSWVQNSADATILTNAAAAVTPPALNSVAALTSATLAAVAGTPGRWTLTLSAPNAAGSANVALNLGTAGVDASCQTGHGGSPAGLPWLRSTNGACAAGVAGTADPSARATFGIYAPETRHTVHTRELLNR